MNSAVVRVRLLVNGNIVSARHQETLAVDKPAVLARVFRRHTFFTQRGDKYVGNSDAGLAGTEEQDLLIRKRTAGDTHRGDNAGHGNRTGSLDIVIKDAMSMAILFEQAECIGVAEVFNLDQHVGK